MLSYSSYKQAGVYYLANACRSNQYTKCIKHNKPSCNVFSVSVPTIERIVKEEEKLWVKAESA